MTAVEDSLKELALFDLGKGVGNPCSISKLLSSGCAHLVLKSLLGRVSDSHRGLRPAPMAPAFLTPLIFQGLLEPLLSPGTPFQSLTTTQSRTGCHRVIRLRQEPCRTVLVSPPNSLPALGQVLISRVRPATNSVYPQPNQTLCYFTGNRFLCSFAPKKQDTRPQA